MVVIDERQAVVVQLLGDFVGVLREAQEALGVLAVFRRHRAQTRVPAVPFVVTGDQRVEALFKVLHGVVGDDGLHAGLREDVRHDLIRDVAALAGQLAGVVAHFLQAGKGLFQILGILREAADGIKLSADDKVFHLCKTSHVYSGCVHYTANRAPAQPDSGRDFEFCWAGGEKGMNRIRKRAPRFPFPRRQRF